MLVLKARMYFETESDGRTHCNEAKFWVGGDRPGADWSGVPLACGRTLWIWSDDCPSLLSAAVLPGGATRSLWRIFTGAIVQVDYRLVATEPAPADGLIVQQIGGSWLTLAITGPIDAGLVVPALLAHA